MTLTMYGIKNCDTVAKARRWLDDNGLAYDFHDYKALGIDAAHLQRWAGEVGWEVLLNRAGTTFRKLPEGDRQDIDQAKAIALMIAPAVDDQAAGGRGRRAAAGGGSSRTGTRPRSGNRP